jgi:hypothetical protein
MPGLMRYERLFAIGGVFFCGQTGGHLNCRRVRGLYTA